MARNKIIGLVIVLSVLFTPVVASAQRIEEMRQSLIRQTIELLLQLVSQLQQELQALKDQQYIPISQITPSSNITEIVDDEGRTLQDYEDFYLMVFSSQVEGCIGDKKQREWDYWYNLKNAFGQPFTMGIKNDYGLFERQARVDVNTKEGREYVDAFPNKEFDAKNEAEYQECIKPENSLHKTQEQLEAKKFI